MPNEIDRIWNFALFSNPRLGLAHIKKWEIHAALSSNLPNNCLEDVRASYALLNALYQHKSCYETEYAAQILQNLKHDNQDNITVAEGCICNVRFYIISCLLWSALDIQKTVTLFDTPMQISLLDIERHYILDNSWNPLYYASSNISLGDIQSISFKLFAASCQGNLQAVQELLSRYTIRDNDPIWKSTPLHWACENGHIELAEFLHEHKFSFSLVNHNAHDPLDCAIARKQYPLLQYFATRLEGTLQQKIAQSLPQCGIYYAIYMQDEGIFNQYLEHIDKKNYHKIYNMMLWSQLHRTPRLCDITSNMFFIALQQVKLNKEFNLFLIKSVHDPKHFPHILQNIQQQLNAHIDIYYDLLLEVAIKYENLDILTTNGINLNCSINGENVLLSKSLQYQNHLLTTLLIQNGAKLSQHNLLLLFDSYSSKNFSNLTLSTQNYIDVLKYLLNYYDKRNVWINILLFKLPTILDEEVLSLLSKYTFIDHDIATSYALSHLLFIKPNVKLLQSTLKIGWNLQGICPEVLNKMIELLTESKQTLSYSEYPYFYHTLLSDLSLSTWYQLIDSHIIDLHSLDAQGNSVLHNIPIREDNMSMLIQEYKLNITHLNNDDDTPLTKNIKLYNNANIIALLDAQAALSPGDFQLLATYPKLCAIKCNLQTANYFATLQWAVQNNNHSIYKLILQHDLIIDDHVIILLLNHEVQYIDGNLNISPLTLNRLLEREKIVTNIEYIEYMMQSTRRLEPYVLRLVAQKQLGLMLSSDYCLTIINSITDNAAARQQLISLTITPNNNLLNTLRANNFTFNGLNVYASNWWRSIAADKNTTRLELLLDMDWPVDYKYQHKQQTRYVLHDLIELNMRPQVITNMQKLAVIDTKSLELLCYHQYDINKLKVSDSTVTEMIQQMGENRLLK